MLKTLKFIQGAVAKNDLTPILTHFNIEDGRITGYNGRLSISAPIDISINAMPPADSFIRCIGSCVEEPMMTLVDGTETQKMLAAKEGRPEPKRLLIVSGRFRAYLPILPDTVYPIAKEKPAGLSVAPPENFLEILKAMRSFISDDASRTWSTGLLFGGGFAFATNNISLARYTVDGPPGVGFSLPVTTVDEILRIGEVPDEMIWIENGVAFLYEGERWIISRLLDYSDMPNLAGLLAIEITDKAISGDPLKVLFSEVARLRPFCEDTGRIYFKDGNVQTSLTADDGVMVEGVDLPDSCFNVDQFLKLEDSITSLDLSTYPKPCPFEGERLKGVIVGMIV